MHKTKGKPCSLSYAPIYKNLMDLKSSHLEETLKAFLQHSYVVRICRSLMLRFVFVDARAVYLPLEELAVSVFELDVFVFVFGVVFVPGLDVAVCVAESEPDVVVVVWEEDDPTWKPMRIG